AGRRRWADAARRRHAAVDGGAAHLHGGVRPGIDARDGGVVGPARLAAGARRQPSSDRARRVARCRLRVDGARSGLGIPGDRQNVLAGLTALLALAPARFPTVDSQLSALNAET